MNFETELKHLIHKLVEPPEDEDDDDYDDDDYDYDDDEDDYDYDEGDDYRVWNQLWQGVSR